MKAVLDLGTNTFNLLIAEVWDNTFHTIYQEEVPVKIGSGGINNGLITDEAYQRALLALEKYALILNGYPIEQVVATGTSAIRNARNGKAFLEEVKQRFGFEVNQISGEKEAELIYLGASFSFPWPSKSLMVMDIGGGSVEFIIGEGKQILWKHSFEIGAARLVDRFKPSNPITPEEISQINTYLNQKLEPLFEFIDSLTEKPSYLVGTAGTFDTLTEVVTKDMQLPTNALSEQADVVSDETLHQFLALIIHSTAEERKHLKGLLDFRLDMIVVASLLLQFVKQRIPDTQLICSKYALKEGLLFYTI